MIDELDVVELICDLPELGLKRGDRGAVVHIHGDHQAYELDVGRTPDDFDTLTVPATAVRLNWKLKPLSARAAE